MKYFKLFVAASTLTFFFYSCKKNDVAQSTSTLVKTFTKNYYDTSTGAQAGSVTYNVTYDANGKIVNLVSTDNTDKFVYQYPSATKYTVDEYLYSSTIPDLHKEFYLNSFSLPDSIFIRQYGDDTITEKYTYNSSKQWVKKLRNRKYTYPVTYYYFYDSNGNLTKDSTINVVNNYSYSNLINNTPLTDSYDEDYVFQSPNLLLKQSWSYVGVAYSISHSYTFDSNNRMTSEKTVDQQGKTTSMKTYTY